MANASSARLRRARGRGPATGAWTALVLGAGLLGAACPPAAGPCASDQDCGGGALCVDAVCRKACNSAVDCTGREHCADGVCMPTSQAGDAQAPDVARTDLAPVDTAAVDARAADQGAGDGSPEDRGLAGDAAAAADRSVTDAAGVEDAGSTDRAGAVDSGAPADSAAIADAGATEVITAADSAVDAAVLDAATVDAPPADLLASDVTTVDVVAGDAVIGDATNPDAGGTTTPCGTVELMADDFADGVADWRWHAWAMPGTRVSEAQGHLEIGLAANNDNSSYAGYNAAQHTSLLGRTLQVELVQGVSTTGAAQASLIFRRDTDNQLTITQTGGTLRATLTVDGVGVSGAAAYTADLHRWLRLREADGRVHFETSADGQDWSSLYVGSTPAFASSGRVMLEAGTYKAETAPGIAIFDNLGLAASAVDWCPPSTLQDAFDDGAIGLAWDPDPVSGCLLHVDTQALLLEARDRVLCALPSASVYVLDDSAIAVEVVHPPAEDEQADVGLALWNPIDMTDLELSMFAGGRIAVWDSAGSNFEEFVVADPRVLGIHQDSSGVHWEVLDGEGVRHRLYSQTAVEVTGVFFAILWLDCTECTLGGVEPVRAVLDRVNGY